MPVVVGGMDTGPFAQVAHQLEGERMAREDMAFRKQQADIDNYLRRQGLSMQERELGLREQNSVFDQWIQATQQAERQMVNRAAEERWEMDFGARASTKAVEEGIYLDPQSRTYRPITEDHPLWSLRRDYLDRLDEQAEMGWARIEGAAGSAEGGQMGLPRGLESVMTNITTTQNRIAELQSARATVVDKKLSTETIDAEIERLRGQMRVLESYANRVGADQIPGVGRFGPAAEPVVSPQGAPAGDQYVRATQFESLQAQIDEMGIGDGISPQQAKSMGPQQYMRAQELLQARANAPQWKAMKRSEASLRVTQPLSVKPIDFNWWLDLTEIEPYEGDSMAQIEHRTKLRWIYDRIVQGKEDLATASLETKKAFVSLPVYEQIAIAGALKKLGRG